MRLKGRTEYLGEFHSSWVLTMLLKTVSVFNSRSYRQFFNSTENNRIGKIKSSYSPESYNSAISTDGEIVNAFIEPLKSELFNIGTK